MGQYELLITKFVFCGVEDPLALEQRMTFVLLFSAPLRV